MTDTIPINRHLAVGGAYQAADRTSATMALWQPPMQSADADIIPTRPLVEARAIDMVRNNGNVASGAAFHKDAVVGGMFMLNARPDFEGLGLDAQWAAEFQQEVESKFGLWAHSDRNWVDASRRNNLTSLLRLVCGVYLYGGEVLLTSEFIQRERERHRKYSTCFQMIELSRLSDPMNRTPGNRRRRIRGGVELDSYGAPVAYHIRRLAPGDLPSLYGTNMAEMHQWSRIRAELSTGRPNVIHVMEQQRPGQTRGVSQLVSGLKELRSTGKFRDIVLQNAVVNASFAASIESELPTGAVYETVGASSGGTTAAARVLKDYCKNYLTDVLDFVNEGKGIQIDGAVIPHLYPGTKLNLHPMGHPGGVGTEFEQSFLRHTAAILDMSYEELSRDYSKANYSSARASGAVTQRAMTARKRMVVERVANVIFRNWFEEAIDKGEITAMNTSRAPNFYEREDAYLRATWIGGARGQIDEEKETKAAVERVRNGLSTREVELARLGRDWRQVFRQLKREEELKDELGLTFASEEIVVEDEPPNGGGGGGGDNDEN